VSWEAEQNRRITETALLIELADQDCKLLDFASALKRTRQATELVLPYADDPVALELLTYALSIEADVHRHRNRAVEAEAVAAAARHHAEENIGGSAAATVAAISHLTCEELFGDPLEAAQKFVDLERELRDVTRWDARAARLDALDHVVSAGKRAACYEYGIYAIREGRALAEELAMEDPDAHGDAYSSFYQWRGFFESNLGDPDEAVESLERSLGWRGRSPRRWE
jgi:hypothetical protein